MFTHGFPMLCHRLMNVCTLLNGTAKMYRKPTYTVWWNEQKKWDTPPNSESSLPVTNKKRTMCVCACLRNKCINYDLKWYMSVYKTCKLLLHLFKRYVLASRLESSYQNLEKQRVLYHLITLQPICITFILVKSVFLTTKLSSEYISTCTKTSTISHTTDFSTF